MSKDNYKECIDDIKFKKINKNGRLKDYFIKSSFASYSSTGDNYSTCNIENIIKNLNLGCRLIHLDLNWIMKNNKRIPIVTNSNVNYLKFDNEYILFEDCCKAISDYGFNCKNKSEYPLILYLNLIYESKYLDVSNRISESIVKHLRDYLLPIKYSYGNENLVNVNLSDLTFTKGEFELGHIVIIKNYYNYSFNGSNFNNNKEKNKRNDSTNLEELTNGYLKVLNSPTDVKDEDTLVGFIFYDNVNKYINTNVYNLNSEDNKILQEKLVFLIPKLDNGKVNIKTNVYNFNTLELFHNKYIMNFIMNQYISQNTELKIKDDLNLYNGELFKLSN